MLKKSVCFLLCMVLLCGLALPACADGPIDERTPYALYKTDKAVCVFYQRLLTDITPVIVKTERFAKYGVYPTLVSEGETPVTYVVLMDATWYMRDRRAIMKDLVEGLLDNDFLKTRLILAPYDVNHGLLWDQFIDTDYYSDLKTARSELLRRIDSIDYSFQGESVPANAAVLEMLRWLEDNYPCETGGIVNVVVASYLLESMSSQPQELKKVQTMVSTMPQLLFHTVQLGARGEAPRFWRGVQTVVTDDYSARLAAGEINRYVGGLERVLLPYAAKEAGAEDVLLYFKSLLRTPDGGEYMPDGITVQGIPRVVTTTMDADVGYNAED